MRLNYLRLICEKDVPVKSFDNRQAIGAQHPAGGGRDIMGAT